MRIAVNTRFLLANKMEGVGWFSFEVIKEMVLAHPEDEFHFFFDRKFDERFLFADNVVPHIVYPQARHPFLWDIYFHFSLKRAIQRAKCDVFLSPDSYLCPGLGIPTVLVMHDLAYEHYPEHVGKLVARYYKRHFPKYAREAAHIFAVSEATKQDIVERYSIPSEKISISYNGASDEMQAYSEVQSSDLPNGIGKVPFFLFVSAIQPRKNLQKLMLAFDALKQKHDIPHQLVVAGGHTWIQEEIEQLRDSLMSKNDILFTGHVMRKELKALFKFADALCYVSLFEGFGIPILEAMWAETPVICSNISSMPEVAGEAAILVDPFSVESIEQGMEQIVLDKEISSYLIEKGIIQRQKFSWKASADAIYAKLLELSSTS